MANTVVFLCEYNSYINSEALNLLYLSQRETQRHCHFTVIISSPRMGADLEGDPRLLSCSCYIIIISPFCWKWLQHYLKCYKIGFLKTKIRTETQMSFDNNYV